MEGLDELLTFPRGGSINVDFQVLNENDIEATKINIHTEPIIMTAKKPQKSTIRAVGDFYGTAALFNSDIIAFNGEAARKLLSNPKDIAKEINPYVFLLTAPQHYDEISEIETKQIVFICLFHHLFFLAKRAKLPSFADFMDEFPDKFAALQGKLGQEKDTKKEVFGVPIADLTKFWEDLKKGLSYESKDTLFTMLEIIGKSPKEIYDWFLAEDSGTVSGALNETSKQGWNATSAISTGTVAPPEKITAGILPDTARKAINKKFAESGRPKTEKKDAATAVAAFIEHEKPPLPPAPPKPSTREAAIKAIKKLEEGKRAEAPVGPEGTRGRRAASIEANEKRKAMGASVGIKQTKEEKAEAAAISELGENAQADIEKTKASASQKLKPIAEVNKEQNSNDNTNSLVTVIDK